MKITANMLTEEMGFIDDEIINIRIPRTDKKSKDWGIPFQWDKSCIRYLTEPDELEVRVLTGIMSIWNHAPEDADICHVKINGNIDWLRGTVDGWKDQLGDAILIERPWWAK